MLHSFGCIKAKKIPVAFINRDFYMFRALVKPQN